MHLHSACIYCWANDAFSSPYKCTYMMYICVGIFAKFALRIASHSHPLSQCESIRSEYTYIYLILLGWMSQQIWRRCTGTTGTSTTFWRSQVQIPPLAGCGSYFRYKILVKKLLEDQKSLSILANIYLHDLQALCELRIIANIPTQHYLLTWPFTKDKSSASCILLSMYLLLLY